MGLVLWIDQNTFSTGLLEKVFKKESREFYTISKAQDFLYLIEDLHPELLVLDYQTALSFKDALMAQYEASERLRELPVVVVDEAEKLPFITRQVGTIQRPFDPFLIPQMLEKILRGN